MYLISEGFVAGIIIGNKGEREAMSNTTKDYVNKFWELIDEMLNALLFLLIGFEMIILSFDSRIIQIGLVAIIVSLAGRYIEGVFSYLHFLCRSKKTFERNMCPYFNLGRTPGEAFQWLPCVVIAEGWNLRSHSGFDNLYRCCI